MTNSLDRRPSVNPSDPSRRFTQLLATALVAFAFMVPGTQSAAAQNPNLESTYRTVQLTEGFEPDPSVIPLEAGGNIEVSADGCNYGHVAIAPDVDLFYSTSTQSNLFIYATSTEDTMILVSLPDGGWVCNDDAIGLNPVVIVPGAPSGRYDIGVGTIDDNGPATLYISEIDPR